MESRRSSFWIAIAISEVVFGLVVFAATRYYYVSRAADETRAATATSLPAIAWPPTRVGAELAPADRFTTALPTTSSDPAVIAQQADEAFANKNYERAAGLYAQLLALAPENPEVYNDLGLTLHYVGRSTEALERLSEGVAIDPTHQRLWLTTGFVYAQTGNIEDARLALGNAIMIDPESDVGRSAAEMLANLPQ